MHYQVPRWIANIDFLTERDSPQIDKFAVAAHRKDDLRQKARNVD